MLHTCTSWYAHAAMFGSPIEINLMYNTRQLSSLSTFSLFCQYCHVFPWYGTTRRPTAPIWFHITVLPLALLGQVNRLKLVMEGKIWDCVA